MKLLEVKNLTKRFGEFTAVNNISLSLEKGEITSIVGPNGAGKTTLLRLLSGEFAPTKGEIIFKGENITKRSFHQTAIRGISKCFQVPFVFDSLSVIDNLKVAGRANKLEKAVLNEKCEKLLERVGMLSQKNQKLGELAHGGKRILELCMSFIQERDLLLSDEIVAGLAESEVALVDELIKERAKSCTPLVVEHRLEFVFGLSDRVITMHNGEIIADGTPDEIKNSEKVRKAYYGES